MTSWDDEKEALEEILCDLSKAELLGVPGVYDLVSEYYCTEVRDRLAYAREDERSGRDP